MALTVCITLSPDWLRFRSGDWGSASPFSIGWWAVVQDDFVLRNDDARAIEHGRTEGLGEVAPRKLPRGALIRYREDYGASGPGRGLKLTAEQVADRAYQPAEEDFPDDSWKTM